MKHTPEYVWQQQLQLTQLLRALAKLSTEQMHSHSVSDWNALLEKKQLLLNAIMTQKPGELFEVTHRFEAQLLGEGRQVVADELRAARELNKSLFSEVAQSELAAQQQMQSQVDILRASLTDLHQRRQLRRMYQGTSRTQSPRFLNGVR